jgi:penicillin-binding protein 1A
VGAQPELGLWSEWGRRRSVVDSHRPVYDWPHLRAAAGHRLPQPVRTDRVTGSRRQPGSAFKPLLYLAAFRQSLDLDTTVPDERIGVPLGANGDVKFIANYDHRFKGPIPIRQALAESGNAVAVWLAGDIGVNKVIRTARELGIRTPLQPYVGTVLGASEVVLLELATAYGHRVRGPGPAPRHRARARRLRWPPLRAPSPHSGD